MILQLKDKRIMRQMQLDYHSLSGKSIRPVTIEAVTVKTQSD